MLQSRGFVIRNNSFSRWLAVASGLAIVVVVTGAAWFYRIQEEDLRHRAETELQGIAHLKADQIAAWRHQRLADAYVLMESPSLSEQVARLMATPHPENTKDMLTRFRSLQKHCGYSDVLLVDADGQVRLRVGGSHAPIYRYTAQSLAEALRERRPVFTDIYAGTDELSPHISIIAPIFAKSGKTDEPVGAIILDTNVQEFLYRFIQSWPTLSRSAETLLVRRDGDSALFLNDLRFRKHTAPKLRIPLSRKDVAAVMAVRGRVGVVRGNDYRGVKVFSALQPIPDSPWFMVAKVDVEEILAAWRSRSILILALTILLVLVAVAAAGLVWQRNDKAHYQSLARAQEGLRESEDKFRSLFEASRDAVMTLEPPSWKFASCNQATVEMFGAKDVEEVTSLGPWEVAPELQPDGRASADKAKEMNETAMREGSHFFEWTHTRIGGEQFPATVLLSRIEQGGKVFLQSTVRDITERKQAEKRLAKINECLLTLGPDFDENINQLTSLCGELLGATCALYNRLDGGMLCSVGRWSTPPDFDPVDRPDGHICYDVIKRGGNDTFIVRNLPDSVYWASDPNVAKYGLKTYLGKAVKCGDVSVGSLCTVFQDDFEPTEDQKRIMGIIASAVSTEELRKRAEEKLRESEEQYRVIFEGSAHGILMADSKTRQFIYANPSICRMLGYTERELLQLGVADIHPKDSLDHVAYEFESQARGEKTLASELPCLRKDGTVFYADVASARTALQGRREYTVGFFADVTDRRELSQQLEVAATQIRGLMTQVVTGNDLAGRFSNPSLIECWNAKGCGRTKCPAYENDNLRCWEIAGTFCEGKTQGVFALKYGDCTLCSVYQSARANPLLELGETFNAMSAILENRHEALVQSKAETEAGNRQLVDALGDASEMASQAKNAKERIEESVVELAYQASHDALTGLPNRNYFEQHLSDLITVSASKKSRSLVVLFLDLDRFKLINDTLGHKIGDLLLVEVVGRLQSCLRAEDLLARMGGDEFTVILPRSRSRSSPESVASRMIDSISRPFEIQGHKFVIGVSIGLASYPSDGTDTVTLLKHADAAMYKAKQAGRGTFRWFTGDVDVDNQQRADIEMDIRAALEKGQFHVYYQPIVSLENGEILAAEALLRWEHPEKGMISPSLFIPIAEETGLIGPIGDYVLRTACAQTMAWRDEGIRLSQIAVNLSTRQVRDASWLDSVSAILSDTGLDARCLNLEVTETDFAADYESMRKSLQKVQELGICLSIDDFGMGQSSLSRLKDFPMIHLKIDGSFIRDIVHNNSDNALVISIIEMAHGQCMKVTAEWVETESQMEILRSMGCDFAQGYFISPALPAEQFRKFAIARESSVEPKRRAA